jgi:hypothetical protein
MKIILRGGPCDGQTMFVPDQKHEVGLYSVPPINMERIKSIERISDESMTEIFYRRTREIENGCVVFTYDED